MFKTTYTNDRRSTPRLSTVCDIELNASLSILDTKADVKSESLVFLGKTMDLSLDGACLVLPSVGIDEAYCDGTNRLRLSMLLPNGPATVEASAVWCVPFESLDEGHGYVVGAKILRVLEHEDDFAEFLLVGMNGRSEMDGFVN